MSGKTFFEQTWTDANKVEHEKTSYAEVPVDAANDNAIAVPQFLLATKSLLTLFDLLGGMAFMPVTKDLSGNIDKIERRYNAATASSPTLQALVRAELAEKKHEATEGLLWLTRGLDLTSQALRINLDNASSQEALSTSFRSSYAKTLSKHHAFYVKPVFNAAVSAAPSRGPFYNKLAGLEGGASVTANAESMAQMERMDGQLRTWLAALEKQVGILNEFMARKEAKW